MPKTRIAWGKFDLRRYLDTENIFGLLSVSLAMLAVSIDALEHFCCVTKWLTVVLEYMSREDVQISSCGADPDVPKRKEAES
jgi:hypothetical protein